LRVGQDHKIRRRNGHRDIRGKKKPSPNWWASAKMAARLLLEKENAV